MMRAFVTVGSTYFDELVKAALSQPVLQALHNKGFTHLVVQCGKYSAASELVEGNADGPWRWSEHGLEIEVWRYKPTLKTEYDAADLVISHAGTSTSCVSEETVYIMHRLGDYIGCPKIGKTYDCRAERIVTR